MKKEAAHVRGEGVKAPRRATITGTSTSFAGTPSIGATPRARAAAGDSVDDPKNPPPEDQAPQPETILYVLCPKCGDSDKPVPCDTCGGSGFVEILRD
jgi:hypothetical protein